MCFVASGGGIGQIHREFVPGLGYFVWYVLTYPIHAEITSHVDASFVGAMRLSKLGARTTQSVLTAEDRPGGHTSTLSVHR